MNDCNGCPYYDSEHPETCCQNLLASQVKDERYEKIREAQMKLTGLFGNLVKPTVYDWAGV